PEATASLWPPIQAAYTFVHRAAHVLANHGVATAPRCSRPTSSSSSRSARPRRTSVLWSGRPRRFTCYDVPALPRTNNDLEHYFGTAHHLERRATGRKGASPALVVRGSVRVVAAVATHLLPPSALNAAALPPQDLVAWKRQHQQVEERHAT